MITGEEGLLSPSLQGLRSGSAMDVETRCLGPKWQMRDIFFSHTNSSFLLLLMGRALFSQNYCTTSVDLDIHTSDTWSRSNPFDPDSDEFFLDAVYEAFLDPSEYQRQQESRIRHDDDEDNLDTRTSIVMQIDTDRDSGVSLGSGSPLLSSRGSPSPMAVGADDPAAILAAAGYNDATLSAEWVRARASMAATYESWMRTGRSVSTLPTEPTNPPASGYIPPLSVEEEDRSGTAPISAEDVQPQPTGRRLDRVRSSSVSSAQDRLATTIPMISGRTVSITPIDVTPVERR